MEDYSISTYVKSKLLLALDSDGYDNINYKLARLLNSEDCDISEESQDKLREMLGEDHDRLHILRQYVNGLIDGINLINGNSICLQGAKIIEDDFGV